jgi:hypothetical protein
LWAFIPVNTGSLFIVSPADVLGVPQYSGSANTQLGIARTKTITVDGWRDLSNSANMLTYAAEYLSTVNNVVYEGSIPYYGLNATFLTPGVALNLDAAYTTGLEALAIPVVNCTIDYQEGSDGATTHVMTIDFSSRRQPYSGAQFMRPGITGQMFGSASSGLFSGAMGLAAMLGAGTQGLTGGMMDAVSAGMGGMLGGGVGSEMGSQDFTSMMGGFSGPANNLKSASPSPAMPNSPEQTAALAARRADKARDDAFQAGQAKAQAARRDAFDPLWGD